MKKKLQFINLGLMLAVLFTVSYQSLHVFSHHKHEETKKNSSEKTFTKNILEEDHCPTCDFKFAIFLSPDILHFTFSPSFHEIPYQFKSNEICLTFEGTSNYLRGPPTLV